MLPIEIEQMMRAAVGHHQSGRLGQAEALYRQILSHSPNHDGALHGFGILALQNNRPDLAIDSLRRACSLQPAIPTYHGNLGNALMALGWVSEAVDTFVRLLELKPDFAEGHNNLGNALVRQGRRDEAVACYRRALELKPDFAEAHNNLGNAYQADGKLLEAEASYRRALAAKPGHAEAYNNLGNVLKTAGKVAEAIACYHRALQLKPALAETHNSLGNALYTQGKLDEAAACYRRALELKPDYAEAHSNLGEVFQTQGHSEDALACYRRALEWAPGHAEVHCNLGNALTAVGKAGEAVESYRRALELKPNDAGAHNNLGIAFKSLGRLDEAVACYRRALELTPNSAEAHNNLGNALNEQGKLTGVIASYRRAVELSPSYAEAHRNLGNALKDQRKLDEAEAHFNEAIRLRPGDDEAYLSRAMLWLLRGDFERGWTEYEWRWKTKKFAVKRRDIRQPQWDGGPLHGRTILLHSEQGLGDTLHFIRYVGPVIQAGGNVIVECQPQLKCLLRHSLGSVPIIDYSELLPPFDVHCPLLSLPMVLRTTPEAIPRKVPYVHADAELIAAWRNKVATSGRAFKVGLAWAGNKNQLNDRNRSMPLAALAQLGQVPHVHFFSLQKMEADRTAIESPAGLQLVDWMDQCADFADTAALIANLDLVISVDTSVSHLAGAMGKPVWTLLSHAACWRYLLDREDSPWYPTMRLFRQPAAGDWRSVVERVVTALAERPEIA